MARKKTKEKLTEPINQPTWLFPPPEENPVLNPKPTTDAELAKKAADREASLLYLRKKAVGIPEGVSAPPGLLLDLIGAFLTEHGFKPTCRIFTTERNSKGSIEEWRGTSDRKLPKEMPTLSRIFKDFYAQWEKLHEDDSSSSDESSESESEVEKLSKKPRAKKSKKKAKKSGDSSESDSSVDSEEGTSESEVEVKTKAALAKPNGVKKSSRPTPKTEPSRPKKSSSSDGTSSESSGDDGDAGVQLSKPTVKSTKAAHEASTSSSEDSSSSSSSSSQSRARSSAASKSKGPKTQSSAPKVVKAKVPESSSSASSSSSSSVAESDADSEPKSKAKPAFAKPVLLTSSIPAPSDSSATLQGSISPTKPPPDLSDQELSSLGSESASSPENVLASAVANGKEVAAVKVKSGKNASGAKKRKDREDDTAVSLSLDAKMSKKRNEPFSRVPKDTKVEEKFASNQYMQYDYANNAHKDLSVVKGKNFTKEKNKKKRGSYRGGFIDTEGGKGIKFDD